MTHVDVVKNEWLAGYQVVVARLYAEAGTIRVESPEPEKWEEIALRPYSLDDHERTRADGEGFLEGLHTVIKGDYLFATEPHDERHCPFHDYPVVAIRPFRPHGERVYA